VVRRTGREIYGEKLDGITREIRERIRGNGPFQGPSGTGEWFTRFHARGLLIVLMMEAARSSETLVNFYQITRRYNPEDSYLLDYQRFEGHITSG
jgi:hypothetical protein